MKTNLAFNEGDEMGKKYEGVYVNLAELLLELTERETNEEKGRFIFEAVKCIIWQKRGVNSYADSLMDQADEYREDNRRRQQEYRDRQRGKNTETAETQPEALPVVQEEKPKRTRTKKADDLENPEKKPYGPFENVWLTDAEYNKLVEKYGPKWGHALNKLGAYKSSTGKTYKSDFAAFFSWVDKSLAEEEAQAENGTKTFKQRDREEVAERVRGSFPGVMQKFGL